MRATAVSLLVALMVPPVLCAQEPSAVDQLTLAEALALAEAREPEALAARADVAVARGLRRQSELRSSPTLSFERRVEPGGTDAATDVGIDWPLDGFRRAPRIAVAQAEIEVAEHQETNARRERAGDVADAYGQVATFKRQLSITDEVLSTASMQLGLLRARVDQGATPMLDRDVVDVEVRRLQAERIVQAGRLAQALIRFKRLLGMGPDASVSTAQSLDDLLATEYADTTNSATATMRPDLQAAAAQVHAAEERMAQAQADARPEVRLFGSYTRMDAGFPQRGIDAGGRLERVRGQFNYLAAGVTVSLPLWNRQQGSVASATAAREAATARAEAVRLSAAAEVAAARARYDHALEAVAVFQSGVRPLARRNLDTVRETYELGRATVFDVLAEQRRYLDAERAHTEALGEALAARVSLGLATGVVR